VRAHRAKALQRTRFGRACSVGLGATATRSPRPARSITVRSSGERLTIFGAGNKVNVRARPAAPPAKAQHVPLFCNFRWNSQRHFAIVIEQQSLLENEDGECLHRGSPKGPP